MRRFHIGHGPSLYAPAGEEREYLLCESCHRLRAVDPSEFDDVRALIRQTLGFSAHFTHFPIVGLCPTCEGGA